MDLTQDIIDQIKMTDFHYKHNVEALDMDYVLSLDNIERKALLKTWGEIMETYLKVVLRTNNVSWEQLKDEAGHNLIKLYDMLDVDSKEVFEKAVMGISKITLARFESEFKYKKSHDWEWPYQEALKKHSSFMGEGEESIKNEFDDVEVEKCHMFEESTPITKPKEIKNGLKGKRYTFEAILNMISAIKVSNFRYADEKCKVQFHDNFMLMVHDCVKSLHSISRPNILAKKKKGR